MYIFMTRIALMISCINNILLSVRVDTFLRNLNMILPTNTVKIINFYIYTFYHSHYFNINVIESNDTISR